jgi:hypothetical protein
MRILATRLASYFLGAFLCVEMLYIPLANFIQLIPREPAPLPEEISGRLQREGQATDVEPVQAAIDNTGHACDSWGEATGQGQGWSLFAPRFGEAGTFLTLDVLSDDGTRTELRSQFEPADPDHYVRFDVMNYRLFYREMSYALIYSTWTPESFAKQGEEWRQVLRKHVTTFRSSLSAYVLWWSKSERPDTNPIEVTISVRVILPPRNDQPRPKPEVVPLARWRENQLVPFDPIRGRFEW